MGASPSRSIGNTLMRVSFEAFSLVQKSRHLPVAISGCLEALFE